MTDPAASAKAPELPEISIETIAETMVAMMALQSAAKKCNASGLMALANVAKAISVLSGDYSIHVGRRDLRKEAVVVEAMIRIADMATDYPKAKADELKAVLRDLPGQTWMLSPRRMFFVAIGEMRHLIRHIGMDAEDVMELVDEIFGGEKVTTAPGDAPATGVAAVVQKKKKKEKKAKDSAGTDAAVKTGAASKTKKKSAD